MKEIEIYLLGESSSYVFLTPPVLQGMPRSNLLEGSHHAVVPC